MHAQRATFAGVALAFLTQFATEAAQVPLQLVKNVYAVVARCERAEY